MDINRIEKFCIYIGKKLLKLLSFLIFYYFFIIVFIGFCFAKGITSYTKAIYDYITRGSLYKVDGTKANIWDGKNMWTITGAVQKPCYLYKKPKKWSVGNKHFQILVVKSPISNTYILPYSDPVPNTIKTHVLTLISFRNDYQPASFVIRSGGYPLKNVFIQVSDLRHVKKNAKISSKLIDIKVVKCWFQAGRNLRRSKNDCKILVPELLLHDSSLVKVDIGKQVNIIKNYNKIIDAPHLVPFNIPARFNQQIWLTIYVPENVSCGNYKGIIKISFKVQGAKKTIFLPLHLKVNSEVLHDLHIPIAIYYLGMYQPGYNNISCRLKNSKQMLAEFRDIRAHGFNNIAICHVYSQDLGLRKLKKTLRLFREAGFKSKKLFYIDWHLTGLDNVIRYKKKLLAIKSLAKKFGFTEIYIYNQDEANYKQFIKKKFTFEIAKKVGCKNFVATHRVTALMLKNFLDIAIIPRCELQEGFGDPCSLTLNSAMETQGLTPIWCNPWRITNPKYFIIQSGIGIKKLGKSVILSQYFPSKAGRTYFLNYEIIRHGNGNMYFISGGGSCRKRTIKLPVSEGKHHIPFRCDITGGTLRLYLSNNTDIMIDNLSVTPSNPTPCKVIFLAYNTPQAGRESPETYYVKYGRSLIKAGFKGICQFAYQTGKCWDDWANNKWRPHVMAYPTLKEPIPTIQWEAFREAIDNIKLFYEYKK